MHPLRALLFALATSALRTDRAVPAPARAPRNVSAGDPFADVALALRGGAGLFDDDAGDAPEGEPTVEQKLRRAMAQAAEMMRGVGSRGAALDALEAAAARPDAPPAELIALYLDARLAQNQELKGAPGDHYEVALRQLANEALAFKASTRLPDNRYASFLAKLSEEAGAASPEAYEADVRERSSLAARELLDVLSDNGNFVARALARVDERVPGIEEDLRQDLERGDELAASRGREVLDKFRAWQQDSAPLEKLRVELLKQLEDAPDPLARGRVAEALRPVVTNVLGDDFTASPE
mmetsp:Transcript_29183/g.90285  ORF Transcript_29183/g.90285 Transcript_29183/m.90285 type:complete len:296 (-) Transcript_29183:72-959(-)